jgi:hypothetical protein
MNPLTFVATATSAHSQQHIQLLCWHRIQLCELVCPYLHDSREPQLQAGHSLLYDGCASSARQQMESDHTCNQVLTVCEGVLIELVLHGFNTSSSRTSVV